MTTHIGFRAVHGDLTSSHGYRWPWPGNVATAPLPENRRYTEGGPCPRFVGDGLCIAKTFAGAAAGGIPAHTCLIVEWDDRDVLGEDEHKLRVRKAKVLDVIDLPLLARSNMLTEEQRKNLRYADLQSADLRYADLQSADLRYANLQSANLRHANLQSADLRHANLQSADLQSANLQSANLRYADLWYADLQSADLQSANLQSANLRHADLQSADLRHANLRYADLWYADLQVGGLQSADLRYANLRHANLRYANLQSARNVSLPPGWVRRDDGIVVPA